MMCLKVFSNDVFQSVFKISHRFQWFSIMCVKVFSKFPIGFNGFQMLHMKVFSKCVSKCFQKSHNSFNGFQMMCFKVFSKFPIGFNDFQIVFKIPHKFQWFSIASFKVFPKLCIGFKVFSNDVLKVFSKCVSKSFHNSPQVSMVFK